MPITALCAACVRRACDCTAIVFKQRPARPEFTQAEAIALPGAYCAAAAWRMVFHTLREDAECIGGEVRRGIAGPVFAEIDAERDAETLLN